MNNNNFNNQYNGMNNQNNFNNQYNGMNNQPLNNQGYNQNNLYNNNSMNQGGEPKKKFDIKTIAIIAGVVVVGLFFGSKLLGNKNLDNTDGTNNSSTGSTGNSLFGGHKNTTGSSEYKDSDVDLNCTLDSSDEKANKKLYVDVIYNYKNYQAVMYNKIVIEDKNGLTDDEYQELIVEFGGTKCMFVGDCTGDHIEIGTSDLGFGTVIDRNDNKVEVTYNKAVGSGATATKEDMKTFEKNLENDGVICN